MFLLGRHAILGQEPPIYLRSTTATRLPSPANVHAAMVEPVPPPRITRSNSSGCDFLRTGADGEVSLLFMRLFLSEHWPSRSRLWVYLLVTLPLPLDFIKISRISNLPTSTREIPRKIFITNILQVKILKAWDLRADSGPRASLPIFVRLFLCRDNDGTNRGRAQGQMSQGGGGKRGPRIFIFMRVS